MLVLLSPAKTFAKDPIPSNETPLFLDKALKLVSKLKRMNTNQLMASMHISLKIAEEVYQFYKHFGKETYRAISLYDGQAFKALSATDMDETSLEYVSKHLMIVSGLYGLVRPFDGISKYRLEMQDTTLMNLYQYWTKPIQTYLKTHHNDDLIINLMSQEYAKTLEGMKGIITIDFIQIKDGKPKSISVFTKQARGAMAKVLLTLQVTDIEDIKKLSFDGYLYDQVRSKDDTLIFTKTL